MKLPRDISGKQLASLLAKHGYAPVRQSGSHMRLSRRDRGGEHRITIPNHSSLKVGTLSGIVTAVARHLKIDREDLARELFGE